MPFPSNCYILLYYPLVNFLTPISDLFCSFFHFFSPHTPFPALSFSSSQSFSLTPCLLPCSFLGLQQSPSSWLTPHDISANTWDLPVSLFRAHCAIPQNSALSGLLKIYSLSPLLALFLDSVSRSLPPILNHYTVAPHHQTSALDPPALTSSFSPAATPSAIFPLVPKQITTFCSVPPTGNHILLACQPSATPMR